MNAALLVLLAAGAWLVASVVVGLLLGAVIVLADRDGQR